ncbi:MAG: hypothetical protein AAGH15_15270 [Myxococcota bacterium]
MRRRILGGASALLVAAAFWAPALWRWRRTGYGDWQQFLHQWEVVRVAALRHGELALWNPWHCGGTLIFEDPQAQGYGPLFWLLALPFGSNAGSKVFLLLHCALGFASMFVACRRLLGTTQAAAAVGALLFAGSGFFAWHGSGGHSAFLPFYFAPLLLLAWREAAQRLDAALLVALIMAWTLWEGGVYPFPFFCLLLALDGIGQLATPREGATRAGLVKAGALVIALMAFLGAWRLLPIVDTMTRYPRPTSGNDVVSLAELADMLLAREHAYRFGHEYVWAEYGAFVGVVAFSLGLLGLVVAARRAPWVFAGALLYGAMCLGEASPFHPWPLLHRLPFFDSLRVPSRFAVFLTLFLGFAAAMGFEVLLRRVRPAKLRTALGVLVPLAISVELLTAHGPVVDRWRGAPLAELGEEEPYRLTPGNEYGGYASFPARGVSTRGCYTGMSYAAARGLREGDVPQASLRGGRVEAVSRTANTITVALEARAEATLVLNQTFAEGWEASAGEARADALGRIEVAGVPAGTSEVTLRYRPRSLRAAASLSLVGCVLFALACFPGPVRRRLRAALEG